MTKYQYLLFDADNTLFDFNRAEYLSFRDTCSANGVVWSEERHRQYSSINDRLWKRLEKGEVQLDFIKIERFRQLLVSIGHADDEQTFKKAEAMRDAYMESLAGQTALIDGAEDICRKLSNVYKMYIITNGVSRIQRSRLEKSSLRPYFRDIFISEELGVAKPSADYFNTVLRTIGCVDRRSCLVIGDSLTSDCAGAIASGLDICYFHPEPDGTAADDCRLTYTIKRLSELESILFEF